MKIQHLPGETSSDHTPLYLQVQQTLKEMIEDEEFGPGERIPSERELSETLGISRMTVRRAVESLIQIGILERRSTSGTFVRQPSVIRHVGSGHPIGITQLLAGDGARPGSQLLAFEYTGAPRKVADHLGLRVGESVVKIQRLRLVNELPFCIETSYIPTSLVPDLQSGDIHQNSSLYELLRTRYKLEIDRSEGSVKISRCLHEEAHLLDLKEGDPVMYMVAVVYDTSNNRVEYLKSVNHPDRVTFRTFRNVST